MSSIHVNGWFGDYDKLAMTRRLLQEVFSIDLDRWKEEIVFVGVSQFAGRLTAEPSDVTKRSSGHGFAEFVDVVLAARYANETIGGSTT